MELVKRTPEEQAKIDQDKARPHAAVVVLAPLSIVTVFQDAAADMIERATVAVKNRADAAKMIVLGTSLATNIVSLDGILYLSVALLCQWAEIDKLEAMQRRQALAGMPPGRGA